MLEGESLLNDASSITLFTIFVEFVIEAAEGHPNTSSAGSIIGTIIKKMVWLAVGEPLTCKGLKPRFGDISQEGKQPCRIYFLFKIGAGLIIGP